MKILVLLSRFPYPLEKGDKLRAYHQIKELAKNHEIILCSLTDQPVKPEWSKELEKFCNDPANIPPKSKHAPCSEKVKKILSDSKFDKPRPNSIAFLCLETQKIYLTLAQAARELNVSATCISGCLKGKAKKTKGFSFMKVDKK